MPTEVAIVSYGMSKFGKREGKGLIDLYMEAIQEVFHRTTVEKIDALIASAMSPGRYENIMGPANILAGLLGMENATVLRVENTSGSGGAAIYVGWLMVSSGKADAAIVVGGEKMTHLSTEENAAIIAGLVHDYERRHGVTLPSYAAMLARLYLEKFSVPREALGYVAVKNHLHGSMNPKAHFQKSITLEEYMNSKVVNDPLKVMDYTPISDGAAALLLMRKELAYSYTDKPIIIKSVAGATDTHIVHERDDLLMLNAVRYSSEKALKDAGVSREEIDLIELHDMATILELVELESMGFYKRGEAWRAAMEYENRFDGKLPVNTSGGLKAKGHPIGATGVAQAYEISVQMRKEAGERQVKKDLNYALSISMGGFGNNAYTVIYEKGW
ncbi:MAG: thiolase C-terminal domain-containing protein [Fervidicoccaceae archaeon]